MIKGIIFDLGSTLIYFKGDWQVIEKQGAEAMANWYVKKKHIKLDTEALVVAFVNEHTTAWELGNQTLTETLAEQSLKNALQKTNAPASASAFVETALKVYFDEKQVAWQPYPDAASTLKQLQSSGYKLGLYSNASDDAFVQRLINKCGLRPWLSPTFSSAGWGWRKPKPDGFNLIAQRWGLDPTEIVVVGDTLTTDILGAKNAGMRSILVTMDEAPSNPENRHIQPDVTAASLSALPGLLV